MSLLGNPKNPKETKGYLLILGDSSYIVSSDARFLSTAIQGFQHLKLIHKFVKWKIAAIPNLNPTNKLTFKKSQHSHTNPPNKICNNEKLHLSNDQLQRRSRLCCLCLMIRKLPQRIDFFGSAPVLPRHRLGNNRYPGIHTKRHITYYNRVVFKPPI